MKKLLLLFFAFTAIQLSAQVKVLPDQMPNVIGEITGMKCVKEKDTYRFSYVFINCQAITAYRSFYFKEIDGDFERLYRTAADLLEDGVNAEKVIELPEDRIVLVYDKQIGSAGIRILHTHTGSDIVGVTPLLNVSRLKKLFGK